MSSYDSKQGCLFSPNLFNSYLETMINETTRKHHMEIKVNSELMCSIKFADDQTIIDELIKSLKKTAQQD